jgi:hypothetical protein
MLWCWQGKTLCESLRVISVNLFIYRSTSSEKQLIWTSKCWSKHVARQTCTLNIETSEDVKKCRSVNCLPLLSHAEELPRDRVASWLDYRAGSTNALTGGTISIRISVGLLSDEVAARGITVGLGVHRVCFLTFNIPQDAAEKRTIIRPTKYISKLITFWTRRLQGDLHPCTNTPLTLSAYFPSRGGYNDRLFLCRTRYNCHFPEQLFFIVTMNHSLKTGYASISH